MSRALLALALSTLAPGCVVLQCDGASAERISVAITIGPRILNRCTKPEEQAEE